MTSPHHACAGQSAEHTSVNVFPPQKASRKSGRSSGSDKYHGQREMAELCERVITTLFAPAAPAPAPEPNYLRENIDTPPASPKCEDEVTKEPPPLVLFIAYALYRTRLPDCIILQSLLLLDRLKARYPSARGTSSSPHRLFLSSLMLSSKITMDDTYSNKSWAIVGGDFFALREVNQMERELFAFLGWNVVVTREELEAFVQRLPSFIASTAPVQPFSSSEAVLSGAYTIRASNKRARSDTRSSLDDFNAADAQRHKRAADAAHALLQPRPATAPAIIPAPHAPRRTQEARHVEEAMRSPELSDCSAVSSTGSYDSPDSYRSGSSHHRRHSSASSCMSATSSSSHLAMLRKAHYAAASTADSSAMPSATHSPMSSPAYESTGPMTPSETSPYHVYAKNWAAFRSASSATFAHYPHLEASDYAQQASAKSSW
ncbi:uncharacterized protein L969DRAFT_51627 [Mixia osmundae IAM 14324]|uniref:Cyclin N-terminal domain-containing protein n=1 Tax=Mixia osmundae (strain CBS 9802 / IAM 14324 / JCM 22182 / KY 12970) TaxID=764103 RepID=G7DSF9_MIXOS|nr:uncharacterized protein L969DRAFT_51627 [Mixia osmundae IAM 14324]KEI37986.1 hypothetical protein L969DRAFT_51627 [Mixia osmundae IAM 14324]GAA93519.1 hypothetical protein E5Q_00160 [Mixia osmundae IAM 14324]